MFSPNVINNDILLVYGGDSYNIRKKEFLVLHSPIPLVYSIDINNDYCQLVFHREKVPIYIDTVTLDTIPSSFPEEVLRAIILRIASSLEYKAMNKRYLVNFFL